MNARHIGILVDSGKIPAFINTCIQQINAIKGIKTSIITAKEYNNNLPINDFLISKISKSSPLAKLELLKFNADYSLNQELPQFETLFNLSHTLLSHDKYSNVISLSIFENSINGYFPEVTEAIIKKHPFLTIKLYDQNYDVLSEGIFKTILHSYSSSVQTILNGSISLIRDLIKKNTANDQSLIQSKDFQSKVFNNSILNYAYSSLSSLIHHRLNNLFSSTKWNVGIINNSIEKIVFSEESSCDVKWLSEANGNDFKADPFGFKTGEKLTIFYEYYDSIRRKGIIKIHENDILDQTALEESSHLSYPNLFEYENQWYCIPEQFQLNRIDLYKFIPETKCLIFHKTIVENFAGVDPTFFHFDDKYWLFCTNAAEKGADLNLCIFHSTNPEGPWNPHPLNPVKTDICSARPAGTPFIHNGKLYRPSQDSGKTYGSSIVINEIIKLSSTQFAEKEVKRIFPEKFGKIYPDGAHTISSCGNSTLIDCKRVEYKFSNLLNFFQKY